jgi:hypothetical protein
VTTEAEAILIMEPAHLVPRPGIEGPERDC